jgi:uridine kinase
MEELAPIIEHAKLITEQKKTDIPNFIGITGCTGVGKSYFSQKLVDILQNEGVNVALLKFDDFLNPDHFDPHNFHPRFEHMIAHSVIKKILSGEKSIKKPAWNPKPLRSPSKIEEEFSLEGIDLIVSEGEFVLCADEPYDFAQYSKFGIFIDAQDDDILQWNWSRGREMPEKTKDEFVVNNKPHLAKYRKYVEAARRSAAYLLLKDGDHSYKLQSK